MKKDNLKINKKEEEKKSKENKEKIQIKAPKNQANFSKIKTYLSLT